MTQAASIPQLGDARTGKLAANIVGFGRALRRAGVRVDPASVALAERAALAVGVVAREDFGAALEATLVRRAEDRLVFRELFDAYFADPDIAGKLLAQLLPRGEGKAEPPRRRPRVREALAAPKDAPSAVPSRPDAEVDFDAAMTAGRADALRHADFNGLTASEYRLVERLARGIALPLPTHRTRRSRPAARGGLPHGARALREAARTGGEPMVLPRRGRTRAPLPLLVLVDVSGSMERYARLLLAFLHAATREAYGRPGGCHVFAFGTRLTDLGPAFRLADTDAMLEAANHALDDFAGGTRLGESLASLRVRHARRLVGRRTVVLMVTDGLDTGEPAELESELQWLGRHSRRLVWLNPLLRFEGYAPLAQGAAVLDRHAHARLAVHNLSRLEDLAQSLATLMKRR